MITVVTPTLRRPEEVAGLLGNLAAQTVLPRELILVDGAPEGERATERLVQVRGRTLPFSISYVRSGGGTAMQRNAGIERVTTSLVAFVDDDVRLDPEFFARILDVLRADRASDVGGVVGYRRNEYAPLEERKRWLWYRRLRLLRTFEPGRYDEATGLPINANLQPPFHGVRRVDFMTTACAVWRRAVFEGGLRFDSFFRDYGVLEDAHLSLRAGRRWRLLQCGDARCVELSSPRSREDRSKVGYKCVVNYYYVFRNLFGPLSVRQRFRFWRFQLFELLRIGASALRRRRRRDLDELRGRLRGFYRIARGGI